MEEKGNDWKGVSSIAHESLQAFEQLNGLFNTKQRVECNATNVTTHAPSRHDVTKEPANPDISDADMLCEKRSHMRHVRAKSRYYEHILGKLVAFDTFFLLGSISIQVSTETSMAAEYVHTEG